MITIPLGNKMRAEVVDSVLGQLSDGIWENSGRMGKYWGYADVNGTDLEVDDTDWQSGFRGKSEADIRNWFADKAKQVVKIYFEDYGIPSTDWKRNNDAEEVDYMHSGITVADVYECYDYLKQRKGKYQYGTQPELSEMPEEIITEPVAPRTSGGMNPSQQELEDFFLDASTKVSGKKRVSASNDMDSIKDKVAKQLKKEAYDLLYDYESELAQKIKKSVADYDIDWCADSQLPGDEADFEDIINAIVEYEMNILFYNKD